MPVPMFRVGTIGHVEPAWSGDALSGVERTLARGLHAQDVNVHVSADGHVVPGHYDAIGSNHYHDPDGKIPRSATLGSLTLAELERLRPDNGGPQRITAITDWFGWAAMHGFAILPEWKPDPHTDDATAHLAWSRVKAEADRTGARVAVMSIQSWAPRGLNRTQRRARLTHWEQESKARLRTASDAGLPTVLLWRSVIPADSDWWSVVSAVKSIPAYRRLPAGVTRIGRGRGKPLPPKRRRRRLTRRRHHPLRHRLRRRHHRPIRRRPRR